jgi:hypothetical protein
LLSSARHIPDITVVIMVAECAKTVIMVAA